MKSDENPENYVLKNVTEITYIINEYEPVNTGVRNSIEQMISFGLRNYIDENYHIFDSRVEAVANRTTFMQEAADIVKNVLWIHDQSFADDFEGFSTEIQKRLEKIIKIDGFEILGKDETQRIAADRKVGLYTFQKMVYDLKRACELEAGFFLDKELPRDSKRNTWGASDAYLANKDYLLKPYRTNLEDLRAVRPNMDGLLEELKEEETKKSKKRKSRRARRNELTEKIVEVLGQNSEILNSFNARFNSLQNQIDQIRRSGNDDIKSELAEMREMIKDLAEGKSLTHPDGTSTAIVPGEEVVINFDKNKYDLTPSQQAQLNISLIALRSDTRLTAFITGYADKTGDADFNAWISRKRAETVQQYFRSRGIAANRILVNFLGDSQSQSANPQDRKVVVQYLVNSK